MSHPIRKAEIHCFERVSKNGKGANWFAQFHPYKTYPVIFSGSTFAEVNDKAEKMRREAISKYEADCIARQARKEKAKERKAQEELKK